MLAALQGACTRGNLSPLYRGQLLVAAVQVQVQAP